MIQVTISQLSLERTCHRLVRKVLDMLKEFSMDEGWAQAASKILLDKHAFSYLNGSGSSDALKCIDVDWQLVTQLGCYN